MSTKNTSKLKMKVEKKTNPKALQNDPFGPYNTNARNNMSN